MNNLSATDLRKILIEEAKKFKVALDYGNTPSDLEEIQAQIKKIESLLHEKEREEIPQPSGEKIHQSSPNDAPRPL